MYVMSGCRSKNNEEDLTAEMKVFKAAADATHLNILKLLSGGELCICENNAGSEKTAVLLYPIISPCLRTQAS